MKGETIEKHTQKSVATRWRRILIDYRTEFAMLLVFLIFFLAMTLFSEYFFTLANMINVSSQISTTAILAIGMTLVIITSGIDLSVGAVLGISGMISGMYLQQTGNIPMAIVISLCIGLLSGSVNGYIIGYLKLPAFIVTLGVQQICRSLNYVVSDGNTARNFPQNFSMLGRGNWKGIPYYLILVVVLFAVFIWVAGKTKFGRYLYATGSNEEASRLSGINVKKVTMVTYMVSGVLASLAGVVMVSRLMAVDPTFGKEAEMDAIAAAVIGGTSMMGGKGTLWGTIIGVLLVGFLRNALNLIGINPFWQGTAIGTVIIVAVMAEKLSSKNKR